jgi:hypothetical protein
MAWGGSTHTLPACPVPHVYQLGSVCWLYLRNITVNTLSPPLTPHPTPPHPTPSHPTTRSLHPTTPHHTPPHSPTTLHHTTPHHPPSPHPTPPPLRFYSCSQAKLTTFTPHQLSATLAALGALTPDRPPPGQWAAAVLTQVTARLGDMSPPVLVDTLWGLMELNITPHRDLTLRWV